MGVESLPTPYHASGDAKGTHAPINQTKAANVIHSFHKREWRLALKSPPEPVWPTEENYSKYDEQDRWDHRGALFGIGRDGVIDHLVFWTGFAFAIFFPFGACGFAGVERKCFTTRLKSGSSFGSDFGVFGMATLKERTGITFTLPDDCLAALGGLTATYSVVELFSAAAVWHALNIPAYEGTVLTATMSLKQRIDLVVTLGPRRDITENDIQALKEIGLQFTKENGITQKRNRLIHAVWAEKVDEPDKDAIAPLTFARSGAASFGEAATFDAIVQVIRDTHRQLMKLCEMANRWGLQVSFQKPSASPATHE